MPIPDDVYNAADAAYFAAKGDGLTAAYEVIAEWARKDFTDELSAQGLPEHATLAQLIEHHRANAALAATFNAMAAGRKDAILAVADYVEALDDSAVRDGVGWARRIRDLAKKGVTPECTHPASRIRFDGGRRAVVCTTCDRIVTHLDQTAIETVAERAWREHPDSMASAHTELQVSRLREQLAASEAVIEKVRGARNNFEKHSGFAAFLDFVTEALDDYRTGDTNA